MSERCCPMEEDPGLNGGSDAPDWRGCCGKAFEPGTGKSELWSDGSGSSPGSLGQPTSVLRGARGTQLVPCDEEHESSLQLWMDDWRLQPVFAGCAAKPDGGEGNSCLRDQRLVLAAHRIFLVIARRGCPTAVGFVCAEGPSTPIERHFVLTTFVEDRWRHRGYGLAATAAFARYLFACYDIPKLVWNVCAWDASGIRLLERVPQCRLEGIRGDHFRHHGRLFDLHEYVLTREDFQRAHESKPWKRILE